MADAKLVAARAAGLTKELPLMYGTDGVERPLMCKLLESVGHAYQPARPAYGA